MEPMLLALDTTVPFLAASAKKPTKQDRIHFKYHFIPREGKIQMNNLICTASPPSTKNVKEGADSEYSLGSKPLSLKAPSVCRAIATQQRMDEEENEKSKGNTEQLEPNKENCAAQNTPDNRPTARLPDKSPNSHCALA